MDSAPTAPVTMATLAVHAGVSKNTISLALRGDSRIPPATRARIEAIAKQLGYQKNPVVAHLMSELRKTKTPEYRRTLALFNGNVDRDALTRHPNIKIWMQGCERRAESQGYIFDKFWLLDPELNGQRLGRILRSRGINGAIILGSFSDNHLPARFAELWEQIACVVTGVRTHEPTLSFCCVDHHALMLEAMRQVRLLGYQRPALVLSQTVDELVEGRFSAGMWIAQQQLPAKQRVPGFDWSTGGDDHPQRFRAWLKRHKPDVLLTLHPGCRETVAQLGYRVPRDLGLVNLEMNPTMPDWAAMNQRNDLTGEAAVDMLITMLHNNETGIPESPRAMLGSSHWVPGKTVRRQSAGE